MLTFSSKCESVESRLDGRILITIVKEANQHVILTMQFSSTSVFLESCVRQVHLSLIFFPQFKEDMTCLCLLLTCIHRGTERQNMEKCYKVHYFLYDCLSS